MRDLHFIRQVHQTFAANLSKASVQIISHWGGDADSVGASYALRNILINQYESTDVGFVVPEEISAHVKAIMEYLNFSEKLVTKPDVYLLVDVGSLNVLGDLKPTVTESGKPIICLDHHLTHDAEERMTRLVSSKYLATSEIVYDLAEFLNLKIDTKTAQALFLGMYYDTVRLSVADAEVAVKASNLMSRVDPSQIIGMLEPKIEDAERIARLKGLKRVNVYRLNEWFVAVSKVNGYLSSVARVLINAGAHVALVAGSKGDHAVVAARSSQDFQKYAGLTLGEDLARYLLNRFEGDGGGHAGAARIRLKTSVDTALSEALKGLSMFLGSPVAELND